MVVVICMDVYAKHVCVCIHDLFNFSPYYSYIHVSSMNSYMYAVRVIHVCKVHMYHESINRQYSTQDSIVKYTCANTNIECFHIYVLLFPYRCLRCG